MLDAIINKVVKDFYIKVFLLASGALLAVYLVFFVLFPFFDDFQHTMMIRAEQSGVEFINK